jgi:hypothetical protein
MRQLLKTIALTTLMLAPAMTANAQVSFGIHIGAPPAPRAYVVPAQPGPDYEWVEGYQYPVNGHYVWHAGYWTRPPYPGAYWAAPYHSGGRYYTGRWEGPRGVVAHDHRSDHRESRDASRRR